MTLPIPASSFIVQFRRHILMGQKNHARDNLPWRWTAARQVTPYEILISEIMLQQTQVARVLDKYPKFLKKFPTVWHLASASLPDVLTEWQGMGYNRRALYLKRCAEEIVRQHNGHVPSDPKILQKLPGIGPYTAGAIACFAFNKPAVFMDTNIRKVFLHHFFSGRAWANKKISDKDILAIAERALSPEDPRRWNYTLMDYGAAKFSRAPALLKRAQNYHKQSPFLGSDRFFRSQIVQYLLKHKQASFEKLRETSPRDIRPLLASLCKEGLIEQKKEGVYQIVR